MSDFSHLLNDTPLVDCWSFWRSRRFPTGAVPLKRDMDPTAMRRQIIASLFIYERTADNRFRCRLSGTDICNAFRYDATGRYLDEMLPPTAQVRRTGLFAAVLREERPAAYAGRFVEPGREWMRFRRLLLPVSANGTMVDTIFGMVVIREARDIDAPTRASDENLEAVAFATDADLA